MAEEPKRKAKATRKPKFTDKAQSERFIGAARELGVEDTGERFYKAFIAVVKPSSKKQFRV
jgi:hypothetical protein